MSARPASEKADLAVVAGTSLALALAAHLAAGEHSVGLWNARRAFPLAMFPLLFLVTFALVVTLGSLVRLRRFVDPTTSKLDARALLRNVWVDPLPGAVLTLCAGYGITGSGNLVDLYRARAAAPHDALLWALEAPLFNALLASPLNLPLFWDRIYFALWTFLFVVVAHLYWSGHREAVARFLLGSVLAFYLTRAIVLLYPTSGPVFHTPALFHLEGTTAARAQAMLSAYMRGELPQNGLIPATDAMPSLHVGLAALAVWLWARAHPKTLPWTLPWLALTWASTVFLGWHYALDGIGGIAVSAVALALATALLRALR